MPFDPAQIVFYLSGGPSNTDPNKSLGGRPATKVVAPDAVNNLFSKVAAAEADLGANRFRSIYVFNETDYELEDVEIWVTQEDDRLSDVSLGVERADESQMVTITEIDNAEAAGATFTLTYRAAIGGLVVEQATAPIHYLGDSAAFAASVESSLNALTYLSGVSVSATVVVDTSYVTVVFGGADGQKSQQLLSVTDDTFAGQHEVSVSSVTVGRPVNAVAFDIGFENQPPSGVSFGHTARSASAVIGELHPGDGFAVWLRRRTPAGTTPHSNDVDSCEVHLGYSIIQ